MPFLRILLKFRWMKFHLRKVWRPNSLTQITFLSENPFAKATYKLPSCDSQVLKMIMCLRIVKSLISSSWLLLVFSNWQLFGLQISKHRYLHFLQRKERYSIESGVWEKRSLIYASWCCWQHRDSTLVTTTMPFGLFYSRSIITWKLW